MITEEFNAPVRGPLAGIGLLFREDVLEGDLNVVFSTSLSADNISLRDALYTRFKVPVIGEYSMSEMLSCVESPEEIKNSAHVAIASSILIGLTIDGKPLRMKGGKNANITRLITAMDPLGNYGPASESSGDKTFFRKLADVLAVLCSLFPLDVIFISGISAKKAGLMDRVRKDLEASLAPGRPPPVKAIEAPDSSLFEKMAVRMRKTILCSG
jgi:predicted NBD/HSP70 family sugar kinase